MRRFALRCLCLFAPIVVLAAPYVVYLWGHTGTRWVDGPSPAGVAIYEWHS
jgi:hypothetical protein